MANNIRVKIGSNKRTTIVNPNYEIKANVSMGEIFDVSTANVENGYTLVYNSVTKKYEVSPILELDNIKGGNF